ncbi:MAG: SurA N-terminal domain-containing protein [Anaerolineales bacterium]|uniref:SurA N-terminal domain-containing protein n=1 Tax=Promineifilum sp. TaxID=2664178 RepID=UPI001D8499E0|nr:SurA N-terminal domain-containing protein [Anaerolineales bacterium]MCB8934557.1 SurA N-terminal domain-containing protein [Promineifilum sp.]MCO5179063.1 SurA N-terminal domain-containing protein [Promineifilum sp.]
MAKKSKTTSENEALQRQSRKEILIARKNERQLRNIRIAVITVAALIILVIGIAVVNELFLTPARAVATVGDTEISLRDWEARVRFERAQRIIFLENQLNSFGGDVGIIQQFAGNIINELFDPESMGQDALNTMANEVVMCQALQDRGIEITDADIQKQIGLAYAFYGEGVSPTQQPEPTATIQPTPSLTPIPTAVITDIVPTETAFPTPTAGPTGTPFPTATPVSEQEFQDQFGEFMTQLDDLGVDESTYRSVVRAQLCSERLAEVLTDELPISRVAPQASLFVISADTEESANEVAALVDSEGFLTTWNTIISRPDDPEATELPATNAFELLWRTQSNLQQSGLGSEVAAAAFELPVNEPSNIIAVDNGDDTTTYYLIMVSGREDRELSASDFQTRQSEELQGFIDEQLAGNLQINDLWRNRVPTLPALDPKFLAAPTPTPEVPQVLPTVAP